MQNLIRDYGMIIVLLGLCLLFSLLTLEQQMPKGSQVADQIMDAVGKKKNLEQDFESTEKNGPWSYIVVGLIMTILFIGTILFVVKLALS